MVKEAPGPINFTTILTMFGEKLNSNDPEDVIRSAFTCFDKEASGFIHEDHLPELLTTMGDRFTDEEMDETYLEAPIDKKGNVKCGVHLHPQTRCQGQRRLGSPAPMPRPLSQSPAPPTCSLHLLHAHGTPSVEPPSEGLGAWFPVEEKGQERAVPGTGHTANVRQVCPL